MKLTSAQVQRSGRHLVHCIAECRDCGWSEQNYLRAARAASAHVRETGHTVSVDQGIVYCVYPRRRDAEESSATDSTF